MKWPKASRQAERKKKKKKEKKPQTGITTKWVISQWIMGNSTTLNLYLLHIFSIKTCWKYSSQSIFWGPKDHVHYIGCSWKYLLRVLSVYWEWKTATFLRTVRSFGNRIDIFLQVSLFQIMEYTLYIDLWFSNLEL